MHHVTLLTVGSFARASGLPVSALRYYDAAGLLRPAHVDPATGYRRYAPDQVERARLVARMRRTGMPVSDIGRVITADPVTARRVVDAHQRRLEAELGAATAQLAEARELLGVTTSLTVDAVALRSALGSVRHAVGEQADWPALHGVLFDVGSTTLRLVATDRHRLAVSALPAAGVDGPPVRVIVPVAVVEAFLDRPETGQVGVSLTAGRVTLGGLDGTPVDALYPDYEAVLAAHGFRGVGEKVGTSVTAPDLLYRVETANGADAGRRDLVLLGLDPAELHIGDARGTVAFDRQYLADAVRSFGEADLLLTAGERDTLRLAAAHGPDAVVLLMPVRLAA